jgi:hypothetical protein
MPNVTITPDEEECIIKTQSFTKTIDDIANIITVNMIYETGSWTGDITNTQKNAIQATSDAWDPDFIPEADKASEVPQGFNPEQYGLSATLTNLMLDTVMADDNVTGEVLDQLRDVYADTGVAGLENAGFTSTTEDEYDVRVNCKVTITEN